jgi:DNA anti-recombination protein RmuC
MANAKSKKTAKRAASGPVAILPRLTGDAQQMIRRNRDEAAKAVDKFRKQIEKRAERVVREVERKILQQMHIATEEQLHRLEGRVARLERLARG